MRIGINVRLLRSIARQPSRNASPSDARSVTMLEDAVKSRSLEETMRVRDLAELVAESTGITTK